MAIRAPDGANKYGVLESRSCRLKHGWVGKEANRLLLCKTSIKIILSQLFLNSSLKPKKTTEAIEEITFRNFEFLISAFGGPGHLVGSLKSLKCQI